MLNELLVLFDAILCNCITLIKSGYMWYQCTKPPNFFQQQATTQSILALIFSIIRLALIFSIIRPFFRS